MAAYESSIAIAAAPESVWRDLSAVADWPEWLPTVLRVEPLAGRPLAVGARYRVLQPKLRPGVWVVTRVEPPRRFTWESRAPGMLVVADHLVEATAPGTSTVVLRVAFSGLVGVALGRVFRSITQRYLLQEAAALKSRVEAGPARKG
jgi:hypothetical protein